ncbi:trace amine-associated receptor 13c-like [Nothobranchius furzeri]|uniref:trace amine-associated receptor 13c-like n=1 Tax=Nothobranchius furzeri TaxID=105023 RepID=UPI00077CEF2A
MEILGGAELCFPQLINTSCKKSMQLHSESIFIYVLLSCISFVTVTLNLLVIISISHFRQLHTPTNFFLLSLAVSDLLVGLLLMPFQIMLLGGCWYLGNLVCVMFKYNSFVIPSASVGHMVLISVDRFVAICDPLCYPSKITQKRVKVCVCMCWIGSVLYNGAILNHFLKQPEAHNSCSGKCIVTLDVLTETFDLIFTFIGPITVIIILYMRVFVVAVSQARAMRSHIASVTLQDSVPVTAKKSERKAATALGVVVLVFLICFFPYFYSVLAGQDYPFGKQFSAFGIWLLYFNSCLNPLIYTFFYPWFRKSVKLIITFQICQPYSSDANIQNDFPQL